MAKSGNGLRHHAIHKTKLSLLLLVKILFAFLSFFLVMAAISIVSPWAKLELISFSSIIVWGISLAVILILYLILVVRVLRLFKFR